MRKLILSMNVSLDGFMAGPQASLDWHLQCWTSEMGDELAAQLTKADTLVLGRITFNIMAAYWPAKTNHQHCRDEDFAYANMMNHYKKIVFSATLPSPAWQNTTVVRSNAVQKVGQLKQMQGKSIMLYGSCQLAETMIKARLVDEYQLWIHPVLLGTGKPLFNHLQENINLQLLGTKTFSTGVVLLKYRQTSS